MALYFTTRQKDCVRAHLERARAALGPRIRDEPRVSQPHLLKPAHAAVDDALLCVEADAGAIHVLVILDRVEFARIDAEAALCVERAALVCTEVLRAETYEDR